MELQAGVLRANCIDCLDRTNVAQFTYGHAALGRQLHALGLKDEPGLDLHASVVGHLMHMYEAMGHVLARQARPGAAGLRSRWLLRALDNVTALHGRVSGTSMCVHDHRVCSMAAVDDAGSCFQELLAQPCDLCRRCQLLADSDGPRSTEARKPTPRCSRRSGGTGSCSAASRTS